MKRANFSSFLKWLLDLAAKRELVSLNERKTLTGINVELNISLIGTCSVQNDCFFTNELIRKIAEENSNPTGYM